MREHVVKDNALKQTEVSYYLILGFCPLRRTVNPLALFCKEVASWSVTIRTHQVFCPCRLLARTLPFQGGKDGSKPFRGTILKHTILLVHTTGYERVLTIVCFNMVPSAEGCLQRLTRSERNTWV